jgi:hypothetical protein
MIDLLGSPVFRQVLGKTLQGTGPAAVVAIAGLDSLEDRLT